MTYRKKQPKPPQEKIKWSWIYICDDFYEGWLPVDLEAFRP